MMKRLKSFYHLHTKYFEIFRWIFLMFVFLDFLCIITVCVTHITTVSLDREWPFSPIFLTLLCLITFSCLIYFSIESLIQENIFELIGFIIVSLFLRGSMTWSAIEQFVQTIHTHNVSEKVILIVLTLTPMGLSLICQIAYFLLFFPVTRRFGWKRFETVGTNPRLLRAFRGYQIFVVGMKVQILLILCVFPALLFYVHYTWVISYVSLSIYVIAALIWSIFILFPVVKWWENTFFMIVHILCCLIEPAYFTYKLIVIWLTLDSTIRDPEKIGSDFSKTEIGILLSVLLTLDILWRFVIGVLSIVMIFSFKRGLKTTIHGKRKSKSLKWKKSSSRKRILFIKRKKSKPTKREESRSQMEKTEEERKWLKEKPIQEQNREEEEALIL